MRRSGTECVESLDQKYENTHSLTHSRTLYIYEGGNND